MNHPAWIGDLTADQRDTAFGNGAGQIGMTILRMHIDENKANWNSEVATAKRARELGAIAFASPWNPPAAMTEVVGGNKRLRYEMYDEYATHLNDFYNFMKTNGVELYAVSVQNEPDYAQDWTAWTPDEILRFMKENAGSIQTKVIAPESFQFRKVMSDPILDDAAALANLDVLGAHLYGTQLRDFPYPLFKSKGAGKELWMTEVYTESDNDADLWPLALDVAYNIHNAMVEAEFDAYVWWYIRRKYGPIKENGQVSKRGYCMAQYSKFVRPGFVRIDVTKNPTTDVYVSAYKNDTDVVVVVVNRGTSSKSLTFSAPGTKISSYEKFTTSSSKSLGNDGTVQASNGSFSTTFDGQSVTTLRGRDATAGTGGAAGAGGVSGAGGSTGSGGAAGAGGSTNAGGASSSGGSFAAGGVSNSAGSTSTGGPGGSSSNQSSGGAVGTAGTAGAMTSGTGAASSSSGGAPGQAAANGAAPSGVGGSNSLISGAGGEETSNPDDNASGCTCETVGGARKSATSIGPVLIGLFGLFGLLTCRRRRSTSGAASC